MTALRRLGVEYLRTVSRAGSEQTIWWYRSLLEILAARSDWPRREMLSELRLMSTDMVRGPAAERGGAVRVLREDCGGGAGRGALLGSGRVRRTGASRRRSTRCASCSSTTSTSPTPCPTATAAWRGWPPCAAAWPTRARCCSSLAGDVLSPSLLSKYYSGRQMVEALNAAKLDYATFGNHEFELPRDTLEARIAESNFKWLSSNCTQRRRHPVSQGPALGHGARLGPEDRHLRPHPARARTAATYRCSRSRQRRAPRPSTRSPRWAPT